MKTYAKILGLLVTAGLILLLREIGLTMRLSPARSDVSARKWSNLSNLPEKTAPSMGIVDNIRRDLYSNFASSNPVTFIPMSERQGNDDFTSPNTTKFKLVKDESDVHDGQVVIVTIEAYTAQGQRRSEGGDFWYAVMRSSDSKISTAGHVTDHRNGTYTVYFYAAWSGLAHSDITLVYTSQTIRWLYEFWQIPQRISWRGIYDHGNNTVKDSRCDMKHLPASSSDSKCAYAHELALGKTAFVCDASPEHCGNLAMTQGNLTRLNEKAEQILKGHEYLFSREYLMQKLENGPSIVRIKGNQVEAKRQYEENLPSCGSKLRLPVVTGYWTGDTWHSLICKLQRWEKAPMTKVKECLRGKDMYFLGDSTTRQFSNVVVELVGMVALLQRRHAARTYRRVEDPAYNISFTFQHHPWAVGGSPYPINEVRFEGDVIDSLHESQCNYVVLVGPYAHYTSWTREDYIERLQRLREALVRLKTRCPNSSIFIKGSKPRDHAAFISYIHSNDFFLYEMNKLMKKVFQGVGATFLDVWDMNLSYPAPNNIHMPMEVIRQEANLFLSYLCHT